MATMPIPLPTNGFGLMRKVVPDERAFPVLATAIRQGATVWSIATHYGTPDENSLHLMKRYFSARPEDAPKVTLCLRAGVVSIDKMDCSPANMRRSLEVALDILGGTKSIDLYGPGRVDPNVAIEHTVREVARLVAQGLVKGIVLSEVSAATIRRAAAVHSIAAVETEVSLWAREVFDNGVASTCKELGIPILAYSPLGRGMLAGNFANLDDVANGEFHSMYPRFQAGQFEQNLELVRAVQKLATQKGCTSAQLALAWLRYKGGETGMPAIIPVPGARSQERVEENYGPIVLSPAEMDRIQAVLDEFPVAGERYPEAAARFLEY
ncbi:hypothetical protein ANO11243_050170 [Dothideomycetidae sp. 11243]|nr:hypothetical protein ANO11243_050170 [fungal sp. No.11243]